MGCTSVQELNLPSKPIQRSFGPLDVLYLLARNKDELVLLLVKSSPGPGLHLLQGADLLVELSLAFALGGDQARLFLLGQAPPSGQVDQEFLIAVTACPPYPLLPQVASVLDSVDSNSLQINGQVGVRSESIPDKERL